MIKKLNLKWTNVLFFGSMNLITFIGAPIYMYFYGISTVAVCLFFFMFAATLMSVTGGYHRLFAHRTYEAAGWLKFVYLVFGAAAFQESCLKWSSEHRIHHKHVDEKPDPYNIKRGFFWAHMGWIISAEDPEAPHPQDLLDDRLVMWQYKYWVPLGIAVCYGLPTLVGALFGDAIGGLLFGGIVRLTLAHHFTFFINSYTHTFGAQPYCEDNTARDSWIAAFLTFGEGYHNYHHWYARDYRNGIKLYHWDPGKWFIKAMSWFGQTWNLKKAPEEAILRARLHMQRVHAENSIDEADRQHLEQLFESITQKINDFGKWRRALVEATKNKLPDHKGLDLADLKRRFKEAKHQYQEAMKDWELFLQQLNVKPATA